MKHSIIDALAGAKIWNRIIDGLGDALVLIIPEYDAETTNALSKAVKDYYEKKGMTSNQFFVIISDTRIKKTLSRAFSNVEFVKISEWEMKRLISYSALSTKHYGVSRKKNVKIISFERLYAGQAQRIRERGLFPLSAQITEMILMRE